ncbi:hypothetical protein MTO96_009612 [Rhipicephalus appendiculatus]
MRFDNFGAEITVSKFPRRPGTATESVMEDNRSIAGVSGPSKQRQKYGRESVDTVAGGGTLDFPRRASHERDRAAAPATKASAQAKLRLGLASATVTWGTFLVLAATSVTLAITPNAMYLIVTGLVTPTIHHFGRGG